MVLFIRSYFSHLIEGTLRSHNYTSNFRCIPDSNLRVLPYRLEGNGCNYSIRQVDKFTVHCYAFKFEIEGQSFVSGVTKSDICEKNFYYAKQLLATDGGIASISRKIWRNDWSITLVHQFVLIQSL